LLIENGADIELAAIDNTTPLMIATFNNRKDVAEILLNAGANINAINSKGLTALVIAAGHEDVELATTLLQYRESELGKNSLPLPTKRRH
jgi:ankyrin repeat protein